MPPQPNPTWLSVKAASAAALRGVAAYTLPPALDARMLDLRERKGTLSPAERDELLAWVAFTNDRSADKFAAELALRQVEAYSPIGRE